MSSIFDLKTSPAELPSITQGTANLSYQQISSQPEITNASFGGGTKRFRFDIQGTKWWVPSRSYFRTRLKFYRTNTVNQPLAADNIAPAPWLMSGLFQSGEVKFANRTVCKIEDNMAQIDALQSRLTKSKAWLDSVGQCNFWQPTFAERQKLISTGMYDTDFSLVHPGNQASTIAITAATGAVVGANTLFLTELQVGDFLQHTAADGTATWVPVVAITDNTNAFVAASGAGVGADLVATPVWQRARYVTANNGQNIQEIIWQPPFSIFNSPNALPVGSYEIDLTPFPDATWQKNIIQSIGADKTFNTDYNVVIDSMYLYISTMEGQRVENMTYYLSLDEINMQQFGVDANTSFQKKQADVSPSTYALTCSFQAQSVGNNTLTPPSLFKFAPTGAAASELDLRELYIQYAGQTRPSPYADPEYSATTDYITQRWVEDQIYTGGFFDNGGFETKDDWINRGPYYHFSWPKDGNDTSTRSYVNYKFGVAPNATDGNLLLFSHYKKTIGVSIVNGMIADVSSQDA